MVCSNVKSLMGMLAYVQVSGHKAKLEKLNILIWWWISAKSVYDNSDCIDIHSGFGIKLELNCVFLNVCTD